MSVIVGNPVIPEAPVRYERVNESGFRLAVRQFAETVNRTLSLSDAALLSSAFAIDTTGVSTLTIAHGLRPTPVTSDVQLTVVTDSAVVDWAYDLLTVFSVDATNVTAKIHVSTASGTTGATAKLACRVRRP